MIKSEKELTKLMSKKAVEAVRYGWLLDMKHHSPKEFNAIIAALLENRKRESESVIYEQMVRESYAKTSYQRINGVKKPKSPEMV